MGDLGNHMMTYANCDIFDNPAIPRSKTAGLLMSVRPYKQSERYALRPARLSLPSIAATMVLSTLMRA